MQKHKNTSISERVIREKMLDKRIISALKEIDNIFSSKNIKFYVVGSTSLALQGLDFQPRDIDIIIDVKDFSKSLNLLKGHLKKEPYEKDFNGIISKIYLLTINDIEIEILGKTSKDEYYSEILTNQVTTCLIEGMNIRCSNLNLEYKIKLINNSHKAQIISKYINKI